MLPRPLSALFLAALVVRSALAAEALILIHGNIHTGSAALPRAEAVLVQEGRIFSVGSSAEIARQAPAGARVIDLQGRTVVPGLTDAHVHLAGIGARELTFNLEGTSSLADLQTRLRERARQTPAGKWITGRGWIESKWVPAAFPTAAELDAAAPEHPVALKRADGHAIVVNSAALKLAGIDQATANPAGGEIVRDPRTGAATGMLVDAAKDLVERLIVAPDAAEISRALEAGAARELSLGWTQVHVAGVDLPELTVLRRLVAEERIKLRIYAAANGPGPAADELLTHGPGRVGDGRSFTSRTIKLYMDGALGSRGAALLEPYADYPGSGLLLHSEAELMPVLLAALRVGVQVETHAIGDRGNRLVLDLYERAFAAVPLARRGVREPRWRIEHAQILNAADIPRFAQLGVIASMQPSHAIGDLYFAPARLGAGRLTGAYAWRSLLDAHAVIAGGSDAPVERGEPMIEFYAAVTRRAPDGFSDANWHREQRVTRAEALRMFTLAPAFASFEEDERGSIEPGKVADFTVLSADLMTIPEAEILTTRCLMTLVGGEVVFDAK